MKKFLKEKFLKIQIASNRNNDDEFCRLQRKRKEEEENTTKFSFFCGGIMKLIHFILLIIFASLSIYSSSQKKPETTNEHILINDVLSLLSEVTSQDSDIFSDTFVKSFYKNIKDIKLNNDESFSFFLFSPIRFTFVKKFILKFF